MQKTTAREDARNKNSVKKESMMTTAQTAQEFVRSINTHNVEDIVALMSSDHVFIDSLGNRCTRPAIDAGWQQYFAMVPDYCIKVDQVVTDGDVVVLIGTAGGTYVPEGGKITAGNRWKTPAVWRAVIKDGEVSEWRIYSDNEPIREKMRAVIQGVAPGN
jgi:ketosteroid isomerase-like protein